MAVGTASYGLASTHLPAPASAVKTSTPGPTPTLSQHQGILGNATIEYVAPVCALTGSVPAQEPALVIISTNGRVLAVQLSWSLIDHCILFAPFKVGLNAGTYLVTLSPCYYAGCRSLPITVTVEPGIYTPVVIKVITGIV